MVGSDSAATIKRPPDIGLMNVGARRGSQRRVAVIVVIEL
jgi:hypothetical protein